MEITDTIDGKIKVGTEASVRRHLKLEDSNGISIFPTTEIFKQLALMGSIVPDESHHTPMGAPSTSPQHLSSPPSSFIRQETEITRPCSPTQTYIADEAASIGVGIKHEGAATTVTSLDVGQGSGNIDKTPSMPHDLPLLRVNTLESDKGRIQHNELIDLVTKLSNRVLALETDLKQSKKVYDAAYMKRIMKVKKLEKTVKTSQARRRAKIIVSDEEVDFKDPSKQGRSMIEEIDQDAKVTLVTPIQVSTQREAHSQEDQPEDQLGVLSAAKILVDTTRRNVQTYTRRRAVGTGSSGVSTASRVISTAEELVSTVGALMPVSTAGMVSKEIALRLQEQFHEEERQRIVRVHETAQTFSEEEWENIRARVEADEEQTQRLQAEERNKYSEVDQAKMLVDFIN
uniref:Uncharacterized protein n=1 Tax=Tanacetum cinerariifolium TaxID=118510 RepID=A0A6L2P5H2_TANCI|nr:hypothetical protein [Tanacetum cinerariifolium]